jgi:predicted nuclease of restriction endonuclease-like (RecB) superfamily
VRSTKQALRNGWSVRQLDGQISTLSYERTLASKNKTGMLEQADVAKPDDALTPEEEIKDPFVLEFLGLKDEHSEIELEEALLRQLAQSREKEFVKHGFASRQIMATLSISSHRR